MLKIFGTASVVALVAATSSFGQTTTTGSKPDSSQTEATPVSEVIVTASRTDQGVPEQLLGSSATVLTAQDLQDRQTQIVSDVLRDSPGVEVNRTGTVGGLTDVRLRGAEANHTLVFIDGIKASDPYEDSFDWSTLIADDVAKVEVLRGEQSALYGSSAIGGVINYVTASGADAPGFRARIEGGSFGTGEATARLAGVDGGLDYAISGAYLHTDGIPVAPLGSRNVGADIGAVAAKFTYNFSDDFRGHAIGRYSYTRADTDDQDYVVTGFAIDSDAYFVNRVSYGLLSADYDPLDGRWRNTLSVQGVQSQRLSYDYGSESTGDNGDRTRESYVTSFRFGSDRIAQTLTGDVDAEQDTVQTIDPSGYADQSKHHIDTVGLVGQYDIVLDQRLALGGAIRHDENTLFKDADTYHLQGTYRFDEGTRLHAAAGSGIQNPGVFELYGYSPGSFIGNPNLKPERAVGWEAGVEQTLLDKRAVVNITYFDSVLHDEIATNYGVFPNTAFNETTQSTRRGVEVSADAKLDDGFAIDLAYTYLDSRQDGAEELRRARNIASLNINWRSMDQRFGTNLTVRYNGDQIDTNFATFENVTLPAFTLVNLGADYRLNRAIDLYGRVENLFDQKYQEVFGYREPGRGAYLGVKAGF